MEKYLLQRDECLRNVLFKWRLGEWGRGLKLFLFMYLHVNILRGFAQITMWKRKGGQVWAHFFSKITNKGCKMTQNFIEILNYNLELPQSQPTFMWLLIHKISLLINKLRRFDDWEAQLNDFELKKPWKWVKRSFWKGDWVKKKIYERYHINF